MSVHTIIKFSSLYMKHWASAIVLHLTLFLFRSLPFPNCAEVRILLKNLCCYVALFFSKYMCTLNYKCTVKGSVDLCMNKRDQA